MITLVKNIQTLVNVRENHSLLRGKALSELPCIQDAYLLIENDIILNYGKMEDLENNQSVSPNNIIDATHQHVLPTWCDSHTHLVFAGSRENEFVDKIKGLTYTEIAANGGGILHSAEKVNNASVEELFESAWKRLQEIIQHGTGAVEIKSGYGLSVDAEIKMLRVIKLLKEKSPIPIKSTFLAAHTFPLIYKDNHQGYIDLIIQQMLPIIEKEKLADYVDVFCENGFFSVNEMEQICNAAIRMGLKPKLHVNQIHSIGALQKAISLDALSVDHLETMTEKDIDDLANSNTIGTLLPSAAFFLRMQYQPARAIVDAGAAIALASDYNPGSSPSGNMNFVISLACIQMKLLPEEAINAATLNAAYAMGMDHQLGSISVGKKANLIFTKKIPSLAYFPYSFGSNLIEKVMISGEIF